MPYMDKKDYLKIIEQDIKVIEKYMPISTIEESLHIIKVLRWSVDQIYGLEYKPLSDIEMARLKRLRGNDNG